MERERERRTGKNRGQEGGREERAGEISAAIERIPCPDSLENWLPVDCWKRSQGKDSKELRQRPWEQKAVSCSRVTLSHSGTLYSVPSSTRSLLGHGAFSIHPGCPHTRLLQPVPGAADGHILCNYHHGQVSGSLSWSFKVIKLLHSSVTMCCFREDGSTREPESNKSLLCA